MNYVVITGNILNGVCVFGPFDGPREAMRWAEANHDEWVVTKMFSPREVVINDSN